MEDAHVLVEKGMRIIGHRDHKSYAKYSAVDSDIDQRVCQDVISGDLVIPKGKKAMFEDLISEQRAILDSEEVCVYYLLLCFDIAI